MRTCQQLLRSGFSKSFYGYLRLMSRVGDAFQSKIVKIQNVYIRMEAFSWWTFRIVNKDNWPYRPNWYPSQSIAIAFVNAWSFNILKASWHSTRFVRIVYRTRLFDLSSTGFHLRFEFGLLLKGGALLLDWWELLQLSRLTCKGFAHGRFYCE